jgi:hypothetical protein
MMVSVTAFDGSMGLFISTKAHTMASADIVSMVVLDPSR